MSNTEVTGGSSPNYYRKSLILPTTEIRHIFEEVDIECGHIADAWSGPSSGPMPR